MLRYLKLKIYLASVDRIDAVAQLLGDRLRDHRVQQLVTALLPLVAQLVSDLQLFGAFFCPLVEVFKSVKSTSYYFTPLQIKISTSNNAADRP